jgi:hypothetical protein
MAENAVLSGLFSALGKLLDNMHHPYTLLLSFSAVRYACLVLLYYIDLANQSY